MLPIMWSNGHFHLLLVKMQNGTGTLEDNFTDSKKAEYEITI